MARILAHFGITPALGRCGFCMRAAFLSFVAAGLLAGSLLIVAPASLAAGASLTVAAALGLLWLAHLAAYAIRAARCRAATPTLAASGAVIRHSRRQVFAVFTGAFAFAALATVLPSLSRSARAQDSGCPNGTPYACGAQWCCAAPAIWHCSGYTGSVQNWRQMGSFCTRENSDENIADLRSNCAQLVRC